MLDGDIIGELVRKAGAEADFVRLELEIMGDVGLHDHRHGRLSRGGRMERAHRTATLDQGHDSELV